MRHLTLALLGAALFACNPSDTAEPAAPTETQSASLSEVATPPSPEGVDVVELQAMPQPSPSDYVQVCEADNECRVYQPSDWSPEVECCYEYGCGLDYVAINTTMWAFMRAWRAANAFDCVAHVQLNGPCNNRPITCGLSQDPPEARCVEGICQVAYPDVWPQIDVRAQTCNMNNECVAVHADIQNAHDICCGVCVGDDPVAINTQTREELLAWRESLDCSTIVCAEASECHPQPLAGQCIAGVCALR